MVGKLLGNRVATLQARVCVIRTDLVLVPQNMIHRELRHPELARRELRTEDGAGVADVGHEQFFIDDDRGSGRAADFRL